MPTDDARRLGYGASAEIDGAQVLITSGSLDSSNQISYLEPYDIKPSNVSRSKVKHANGTTSYSGNLSFDVSNSFLSVLTTTKLFSRKYKFNVGIHDGEDAEKILNCFVQQLSLSGAAEGIISATISFVSADSPTSSLIANSFIRDTQDPLGYWYSGNTDVKDWSLTMNQAVTPVYLNSNTTEPRYIKCGLIDFNLSVTTYDSLRLHDSISVSTSSFTLTGNTTSSGFSFVGVNELGNYTHNFETSASIGYAVGGSDGVIIS